MRALYGWSGGCSSAPEASNDDREVVDLLTNEYAMAGRSGYFTAPAVSPLMIRRCANNTMSAIGIVMITTAASIWL